MTLLPQFLFVDRELEAARSLNLNLTWLRFFPSEFYGRGLGMAIGWDSVLSWGLLGGWAAGLFGLSWLLFKKSLGSPEKSGPGPKRAAHKAWRLSLPGLTPAASAVASVQIRQVLRSPRGRMAALMPPLMVPFIGLTALRRGEEFLEGSPVSPGMLMALLAVAFGMLAYQPVLFNFFGIDRAGLHLQLLSPLSDRDIVQGKLAGGAILTGTSFLLGGLAAIIVDPSGSFWLWMACPVLALETYLILGPAGALLSIAFPKAANLASWGKGGNPHPTAAFVGTLLIGPALGPPVGIAALALIGWKSVAGAWLAILLWGGVALLAFFFLSRSARWALGRRREALSLAAQGR